MEQGSNVKKYENKLKDERNMEANKGSSVIRE